ncbi:bacillaene synthase trans-acting acyltransferase [Chitinophaga sp. CF118]|uniref:acyltransferase domain-containing protein n=1 Tax=Chitinophaga sp. CF118 TaxID=1884367 RepID=UPI0008EA41B0|nr:acyltransferase domain-containing protein [Chitinophaga sp. CF118]SFE51916.1 bacillaene synthase trans-acting acyltransferase [Chitinophaga sp. CF118]
MDTNIKIVFLFSGQGSQYRGMGQKLFEQNALFKNSLEQSDRIVQRWLHRSLIDELYGTKQQRFDDLLITHPAIVAVEIAMASVMQGLGVRADFVTGNSLGEFAAGVVSGVWTAETAIEATIEQAKSIVRNNTTGGMVAVMSRKTGFLEHLYLKHNLFLASDNFDGHFTLAGSIQNLNAFQSELEKPGIDFLRLPVNHPFHSPLIENGRNGSIYDMAGMPSLSVPTTGFVSGLQCEELTTLPENYFWEVISKYTDFPKMVKYIEKKSTCFYIDLGPSGTSASFVKYNLDHTSSSQVFQIITPFKREPEQLEKLQEILAGKNNLMQGELKSAI